MAKISIIVPVYNVEKYINDAINSVIEQTYDDIEIILVDDGSKDSSGTICDLYKKKDNRIKVIHQENKGLSGARNTGLDVAKGEYIMFLDSDDIFPKNACKDMLEYIEKTGADFIIGNYTNMDDDGTIWEKPVFDTKKYKEYKMSISDCTKSFYTMNSGVWNKIFRKKFLDDIKVRFVEKLPAEDAMFTTYCFIKSKKVYYMPNIVYHYRLRYSNSISTNCSKKYFTDINKAYRIIYNQFKESNNMQFYRYFYAKSMNYILYKFIDSDMLTQEERIFILEDMKWFYMISRDLKIPTILKPVKYIIESIINKDYAQTLKYCEILNQVRKMLPKDLKEKMSKPNENTYKEMEEIKMDEELLKMKEDLLPKMRNSKIKILNIEDSIKKIRDEKKSIARFGDGELDIIVGGEIGFQHYDKDLSKRLEDILQDKQDFCLIGVTDAINTFENLSSESETYWVKNMNKYRDVWLKYLREDVVYCSSNISRLYIRYEDRSQCWKNFAMMKEIWQNRDVVICEGEFTRLGVGNDLLENCKSIKRIICPSENAFKKYDEILENLKKVPKDSLILMALGPTATVLAYDLAKCGYQAIDLGHIDIEYEWYLKNADTKEKIANKYTNEVKNGRSVEEDIIDSSYKGQITAVVQ